RVKSRERELHTTTTSITSYPLKIQQLSLQLTIKWRRKIPYLRVQTPIPTQLSSFRSQKKRSKRKQRKDITVTQEDPQQDDNVPTPSNDPPLSEKAKDAQAKEIDDLKKRVQRLEKKKKSRTTGLKRLKKIGMYRRVKSSEDQESLGEHEDASKQGRSI
ncbi:hypothetical protein Tco_1172000, partial [Tanacetum coccineum]